MSPAESSEMSAPPRFDATEPRDSGQPLAPRRHTRHGRSTTTRRSAPQVRPSTAGVVVLAALGTALVATTDYLLTARLSQFFDLSFVLVCLLTALGISRSGLFAAAVLPALLMTATVATLTAVDPQALTADHLAFASTLLTGLAHHAAALVSAQGCALAVVISRATTGGTSTTLD